MGGKKRKGEGKESGGKKGEVRCEMGKEEEQGKERGMTN